MSTTGLVLNLFVAGIAFLSFYKAGHFAARLTWPFILTSVPAAFIGGMIHVPARTYAFLLAGALLFAAFRLMVAFRFQTSNDTAKFPSLLVTLPAGAGIGMISGIVGVGGGIFLSPLLLLMGWANPKQTAATSAGFILVNSLAGLAGRFTGGRFEIGLLAPFVAAALLGGLIGSYIGANLFSGRTLQRALGVVLIIAAYKLVVVAL